MKRWRRIPGWCGSGCLRGGALLLNLALALLLALQAAVGYSLLREAPPPIPKQWLVAALERSLPEDLSLEWEGIEADPAATLRAREVRLIMRSTGESLLTCRSALIDIQWLRLLTRWGAPVDLIQFTEATVYTPAMWSGTGLTEPLIENLSAHILLRRDVVEIRDFRGRIDPLRWEVSGRFRPDELRAHLAALRGPEEVAAELPPFWQLLRQVHEAAVLWRQRIATPPDQPLHLRAHFERDPNQGPALTLRLTAPAITLDEHIQLRQTTARARLTLQRYAAIRAEADLASREITFRDWQADRVRLHANTTDLLSPAPRGRLQLARASGPLPLDLTGLHADLHFDGTRLHLADTRAHIGDSTLRLHGSASPFDWNDAEATVEIRPVLGNLLTDHIPDLDPRVIPLHLGPRPLVLARLSLDPTGSPRADLRLDAMGVTVGEQTYGHVHASGWANLERVTLPRAVVTEADGQGAHGAFAIDFSEERFRIFAEGHLDPERLRNYLGTWYAGILDTVSTEGRAAWGDVDVSAQWSDNRSFSTIAAHTGPAVYNGQAVNDATTFIRQGPGYVSLPRLHAETDRGQFHGSLRWEFPPDTFQERTLFFDLNAHLPVDQLSVALDQDWIAEYFSGEEPVAVHIQGDSEHRPDTDTRLNVRFQVHTPHPLRAHGWPLDSLRLAGTAAHEHLHLDITEAGFAGGTLAGYFSLENRFDETSPFQATLAARALNYPQTVEQFRNFLLPEEDRLALPPIPEDPQPGQIQLNLDASGIWNAPLDLTGTGDFAVTGADLGQIRLIGILSRALEGLGIPLTTFVVRDAESAFTLGQQNLRFPELTLQGPAVQIRVSGDIHLPTQGLDMDARVFLLTADNNPLISTLGIFLRPLAYALELRLYGTLAEPEWRLRRNPLNLLSPTP
ncbi:MAG: hypothetical protein JJT96_01555 [Opitutales bacterium]|nr:hypothetical protein [Opitutales bacterium]